MLHVLLTPLETTIDVKYLLFINDHLHLPKGSHISRYLSKFSLILHYGKSGLGYHSRDYSGTICYEFIMLNILNIVMKTQNK